MRTLVWLRADLRLRDNPALHAAARASTRGVACVYLLTPKMWANHDDSPNKIDLTLRTLAGLSESLRERNIPLRIRRAGRAQDAPAALLSLARELGCDAVHFNQQHEWNEARRDEAVTDTLEDAGVRVRSFVDQCLIEPGALRTGEGNAYSVFTPFKKAWINRMQREGDAAPLGLPKKQDEMLCASDDVPGRVEGFTPTIDPSLWPAGEGEALKRLGAFTAKKIGKYKDLRDFPGVYATSRLSPYQCVGSVSLRQCLAEALDANGGRYDSGDTGAVHWISELVWREFYRHFMVAFPRVCMGRAFKVETDRLHWRRDEADFAAWAQGRTGYPIVDAAMRQLARTGWMHNRLRMIVAMFLTKDLSIDWRMGERWFMQRLVDGDLASNNGGWQWAASTGADAAPYFRIVNPVSQSRKFDPGGAFIRALVPELADIEGDGIHEPWTLPGLLRSRLDYPPPMVDHTKARDRVLAAFKALK